MAALVLMITRAFMAEYVGSERAGCSVGERWDGCMGPRMEISCARVMY